MRLIKTNFPRKITFVLSLLLIGLALAISPNALHAQYRLNRDWDQTCSDAGWYFGGTSIRSADGNTVVIASQIDSLGSTSIHATSIDPYGQSLWQFDLPSAISGSNNGLAGCPHPNGNITIAGRIDQGSMDYDVWIGQTDWDGSLLWSDTIGGNSSEDDFPVKVIADSGGNTYLLSSIKNGIHQIDASITKYNENGDLLWQKSFDLDKRNDKPYEIGIHPTSGAITVAVVSELSSGLRYTILSYAHDSGNLLDQIDYQCPGTALGDSIAMTVEEELTVVGRTSTDAGTTWDIHIVRFDQDLDTLWTRTFGDSSLTEQAAAARSDGEGNILIAGAARTTPITSEMLLLKYDDAGNLLWTSRHLGSADASMAAATTLQIDGNNNIFLAGVVAKPTETSAHVLMYSPEGDKRWVKAETAATNQVRIPLSIHPSTNNSVYLTEQRYEAIDSSNYHLVKLSYMPTPAGVVFDTASKPLYVDDVVVVRFMPTALDSTLFLDPEIQFGNLASFLTPDALDSVSTKLGTSLGDAFAYKAFPSLTPMDTISISRLGREVRIPDFWATLVVEIPSALDEQAACDSLTALFEFVQYAEVDGFSFEAMTAPPNDPLYEGLQLSLHHNPTVQPTWSGDIHVDHAWDLVTDGGKDFVRVGIYDDGIDFRHLDFGNGTYSGSKIEEGWDSEFMTPFSLFPSPALTPHGTSAAGIVGAIRSNGKGIAGIAGGDFDDVGNNNVLENTGATLFPMRILAFNDLPNSKIVDGIVRGAKSGNSLSGFGFHLMNFSAGGDYYFASVENAIDFAFHNEVATIAARGNVGGDVPKYPACFHDELVVSVGGSERMGYTFHYDLNPAFDHSWGGQGTWTSTWGRDMDLVAPGDYYMIRSLAAGTQNGYSEFGATSGAAPHVTGTMALMASYFNSDSASPGNLAPEDYEKILELSCHDIADTSLTSPFQPGYDEISGHGRLDAGQALELIQKPQFDILHFDQTQAGTQFQSSLIASNATIPFPYVTTGIHSGQYLVDVYEVTATIPISIPSGYTINQVWSRFSSSNLLGYSTTMGSRLVDVQVISYNATEVMMKGYTYYFKTRFAIPFPASICRWFPADIGNLTNTANLSFSVYIENNIVGNPKPAASESLNCELIPNPNAGLFALRWLQPKESSFSYEIYDLFGRKVLESVPSIHYSEGIHIEQLNLSAVSDGTYLIRIKAGHLATVKNILILH